MSDLPTISDFAVDAVVNWLMDRENMLRPPEATAKFLVLCVKLHERNLPFPPRKDAADHLRCSVALIDTALSQRLATGDIRVEVGVTEGRVQRRLSTIRQRRVIPSPEIIKLVQDAEAVEAKAKGRRNRKRGKIDGVNNIVTAALAATAAFGLSYPYCVYVMLGATCVGVVV